MFVRIGWKSLAGTNPLAYYKNSQIMAVYSFITWGPSANVIKLFAAVVYEFM